MRNKHHIDTNMLPKGKKGFMLPDSIDPNDEQMQLPAQNFSHILPGQGLAPYNPPP